MMTKQAKKNKGVGLSGAGVAKIRPAGGTRVLRIMHGRKCSGELNRPKINMDLWKRNVS